MCLQVRQTDLRDRRADLPIVPAVEEDEELPGATSFAAASGRANPGLCTGADCPTAGFAGAPDAPRSDYAVQFDGIDDGLTITRTVQDDFSVAFWIKTTPPGGERALVDGGNFNTDGFRIAIHNSGVVVRVPGMNFQHAQKVADHQ